VSDVSRKHLVKATILGEEYAIRTDTSPEHTQAVAEHVDRAIRQVIGSGTVVETHKAAILAALQIANELFLLRQSSAEVTAGMRELAADVRRMLPPAKRGVGDGVA